MNVAARDSFTFDDTDNDPPPDVSQSDPLHTIADDIAAAAPDIQEHVIQHAAEVANDAPTDANGVPFDASIHSTGSDGNGVKTAKGLWRRRRNYKSRDGASASYVGVDTAASTATDHAKNAARAAGIALAQMTFMCGRIVGGEEWIPIIREDVGLNENVMMNDAWVNYCEAKGIVDIPPGIALTFALLAYAGPRFTMPQTKQRAKNFLEWVSLKWNNWRLKRLARRTFKTGYRNDATFTPTP